MQSPSGIRITDIQNQNWNSTMESRCNPIDRAQILSSRSGRQCVHSLSSIHKILKNAGRPNFTNQQNALWCWQFVIWLSVFPSSTTYSWKSNKPRKCERILEKKDMMVVFFSFVVTWKSSYINYRWNWMFRSKKILTFSLLLV